MLSLPMTPDQCAREVIAPMFRDLLPGKFDSPEARVLLLAIALQESGLAHRRQVGGPARGLWQFEQGGGVAGVIAHPASRLYVRAVCLLNGLAPTQTDLFLALPQSDALACAIARLLLWTDPHPLPEIGAVDNAWRYYERNWRPGKPHPQAWAANYALARRALGL